jgi:hypothetical protein
MQMRMTSIWSGLRALALAAGLALVVTPAASAATITWTTWTSATVSGAGTATGSAGTVGVGYTGEVHGPGTVLGAGDNSVGFGTPWSPTSTFADGVHVANAPIDGNMIGLTGGDNDVNTILFSQTVINPVMAIFSLGGAVAAEFAFIGATPVIRSGGLATPCCGGSTITSDGSSIEGFEGNGTIQFMGSFTSISWTNPTFENYYSFTVGYAAVPAPGALAMVGLGLAALGAVRRLALRARD